MLFVCYPKILHKHCLQFLLGVKMAPRETENNAYANFWGDKQRALWYVMLFSGVVNTERVTPIQGLCHGVFRDWFIFRHILGHIFPRKGNLLNVCELIRSIRYQKRDRNVIKRQNLSF